MDLIYIGMARIKKKDLPCWLELLNEYKKAGDNSPKQSKLTHFYRLGHDVYWSNGQIFKGE